MTDDIRTVLVDGVLTVRIDRPGKRNALTVAMYAALAAALERAETDPAVRVVLLRGTRPSSPAATTSPTSATRPPWQPVRSVR